MNGQILNLRSNANSKSLSSFVLIKILILLSAFMTTKEEVVRTSSKGYDRYEDKVQNGRVNKIDLNLIDLRGETRSLLSQTFCIPEECPATSGFCKGDQCVCLEGFISVKDPLNKQHCNYTQKKVIVSLLLESFGMVGFGHFYAGRIFYGLMKLVCFYVIICYGSQFVIQFMKESDDTETAYYIKLAISTGCLGLPVLWHLVDLYKWATNQYLDGSDHAMLSW